MLMHVAREFMRGMAQPYDRMQVGKSLLTEEQANAMDVFRLEIYCILSAAHIGKFSAPVD